MSNALVVLGEGAGHWPAGTLMDVLPYAGLEPSR